VPSSPGQTAVSRVRPSPSRSRPRLPDPQGRMSFHTGCCPASSHRRTACVRRHAACHTVASRSGHRRMPVSRHRRGVIDISRRSGSSRMTRSRAVSVLLMMPAIPHRQPAHLRCFVCSQFEAAADIPVDPRSVLSYTAVRGKRMDPPTRGLGVHISKSIVSRPDPAYLLCSSVCRRQVRRICAAGLGWCIADRRTRLHPRDPGRSLAESSGVSPEPPCPVRGPRSLLDGCDRPSRCGARCAKRGCRRSTKL
jgi:hypothetical protein